MTKTVHANHFALKKSLLLLGAIVIYAVLAYLNDGLGHLDAVILYMLLGCFIWLNINDLKEEPAREGESEEESFEAVNIVKFLLGAILIVFGARMLVTNGSSLASLLGLSLIHI